MAGVEEALPALREMLVKSTGKEKPRLPVGKEQAPPEGALPAEALRRLRGPPSEGALPLEALHRQRGRYHRRCSIV